MNITERFLKYVSFPTSSDPDSGKHPSTVGQFALAEYIAGELKELGLKNVNVSDKCYVSALLPATPGYENKDKIGLIAHMDTAPDCSGENIRPSVIEYSGGDIPLASGAVMRAADFPYLQRCVGQHLIVTDGTTLLGADDKAGVAEIVTAIEKIVAENIPHGTIPVCFTPDEEIGEGADHFDVKGFGADYAYTVDGGALGELEYENFNAASAKITINGVNIHPGDAKHKMKNAALIAVETASLFPACEIPAATEGYEGFYHLTKISAHEENAVLSYIIRDHDKEKFEAKKAFVQSAVRFINEKYGEGTAVLDLKDSYYNMRPLLEDKMFIIERAAEAMRACGVEPVTVPIRGGTDGARLTYDGLPCPNLSTGGQNFHGRFEYIPVESMEKMVEVLVMLVIA